MAIEKTVREISEIVGVSRQAVNDRIKTLPPEDLSKNEKGVTVVTKSGLIKLENHYKTSIFEDEPISEDAKEKEILQILVDEKNEEIIRQEKEIQRLHEQLKSKDQQIRTKDDQIAEKDKQLDQQQQLTLMAMNDKDSLKLELDEAKKQVENQIHKGFWARLFGQ
ncbi:MULTISPECIES: DUF536 domain-containing protein [unclassified Streptococcus]|uniref:DUF536 domain-containing protein n=1 Tax=unclassified Streptococcus TaxID=2608887 RepID=UPI00107299C4|nr:MULTISPECIES: DUF536 domain-containing protein [unclassified Streptococcus]MBF0805719.1 DUF536 domain-containing protein [Streptococcus sp. 19428wA2_WM07]TFU28761.1 DUF536 domain-containing protein [Streptococcus sp. WM07]